MMRMGLNCRRVRPVAQVTGLAKQIILNGAYRPQRRVHIVTGIATDPRIFVFALQEAFDFLVMTLRTDRGLFFDEPIRGIDQTAARSARLHVRVASDVARTTRNLAVGTNKEVPHVLTNATVVTCETSCDAVDCPDPPGWTTRYNQRQQC